MAQIPVKDANGNVINVARVIDTGATAGDDSLPVALSTEDKATATAMADRLQALVAASGNAAPLPTGAATQASLAEVATNTGQIATSSAQTASALNVLDDWDESDRAKTNIVVGQAGVAAGAGASGQNTVRVISASDDPTVTALADVKAAVETMDDWDEADRAKVNPVVGQAGIAGGAGAVSLNTTRVVTASDDPMVAQIGPVNEAAAGTDTSASGLNGLLKRLLQRTTALIAAFPASLGAKAAAASLSVTPATDAAFSAGAPRVSSAVIISLTTANPGTGFTAFAAQACTTVVIVNTAPTATDLEVRRGAAGNTITLPAGAERAFVGVTNASDLQVRRLDQSNTPVTFTAEAIG